MTNGKYLYRFDDEDWQEFDKECYNFDEAIKSAKEKIRENGATHCYIGIADEITLDNIILECISRDNAYDCANDMICNINGNIYDTYGLYDALNNVITYKDMSELAEIIKNVTANWLKKHYYKFSIFNVTDEKRVWNV